MNNVPDPALAGKDLPTFKFALEKSDGKVVGNSYGNEATVTQLPISEGIAGASLRLEPGAMRTLHWHPNADEWQYVVEGEVSVTLFGSHGRYRIERLQKGDVGYIPQGYGHSIENVGSGNALMPASTRPSTCRNGLRQIQRTCSPQILASRRKCSENSRIARCSSPGKDRAR